MPQLETFGLVELVEPAEVPPHPASAAAAASAMTSERMRSARIVMPTTLRGAWGFRHMPKPWVLPVEAGAPPLAPHLGNEFRAANSVAALPGTLCRDDPLDRARLRQVLEPCANP